LCEPMPAAATIQAEQGRGSLQSRRNAVPRRRPMAGYMAKTRLATPESSVLRHAAVLIPHRHAPLLGPWHTTIAAGAARPLSAVCISSSIHAFSTGSKLDSRVSLAGDGSGCRPERLIDDGRHVSTHT